MPRATFGGVTFDLLVQGLQDTHGGQTTVREIPAGNWDFYVDLGGPLVPRRTVNVLLDNEAQYLALAQLPGTTDAHGTLTTDDGDQEAVLLSVTRYYRRGGPLPQLCRTEWLLLPWAPLGAAATGAPLPTAAAAAAPPPPTRAPREPRRWR